ncbi:MAG: hypothetical protein LBC40_08810, partial [Dysgonamonadaceae bacterium]|nr:hypothetical protein [Dysgonamonadaceae bacterium]
ANIPQAPALATDPGTASRSLLMGMDGNGWSDTPYGGPETALKVPVGEGTAVIIFLLTVCVGIRMRMRVGK